MDVNGILYSANANSVNLDRIDTLTRTNLGAVNLGKTIYGITLDEHGVIWTSGHKGSYLTRYDPASGDIDHYNSATGESSGGGVVVDNLGNVWAAHWDGTYMFKWEFESDRRTLIRARTIPIGAGESKGAAVDADGYVWTTSLANNTAIKIDPHTDQVALAIPTGTNPYNYSDSTGGVRAKLFRQGSWTHTIDSERPDTKWITARVTADAPAGSQVLIRLRSSNDPSALAQLAWTEVASLQALNELRGRYLQVQVVLQSSDPAINPSLIAFSVDALPLPELSIVAPEQQASRIPSTQLLSGMALAATPRVNPNEAIANTIAYVTVNGQPVEVLDASGAFFTHIEVLPGINHFDIQAVDAYGLVSQRRWTITGRQPDPLDFEQLVDVTGSFTVDYARTAFNEQQDQLLVDLAVRNEGQFSADAPLLLGIRNISPSEVTVIGADGLLPDGTPYYDFSGTLLGSSLMPGDSSNIRTIAFQNRSRQQFDYQLVFYGQLNQAPDITSLPNTQARVDREFVYAVKAKDPEDDPLHFSLASGPTGMRMDAQAGVLRWTPTVQDIGLHAVSVTVEDGRGGRATQRFSVMVDPDLLPNRPPLIISRAPGWANVDQDYRYPLIVRDADGDPLHYQLLEGPTGMSIGADDGWLRWTPDASQLGEHLVRLMVADHHQAAAYQQFFICVEPDSSTPPEMPTDFNSSPIIVSVPGTAAVAGSGYLYAPARPRCREFPAGLHSRIGPCRCRAEFAAHLG